MHDRPHDDALLTLLYDELPPAEADALREKLATEDPQGLDRLAEWQAIRAAVADLPELEPDPQIHYDIIREARRAVEAEKSPSRWWAWLEQLTLMPALAGLLLVVLAAGLTLRLTTDLESADDEALMFEGAPVAAEAPASKAPRAKKAAEVAPAAPAAPLGGAAKDSGGMKFGTEAAAGEGAAPAPTAPPAEARPTPDAPGDAPEAEASLGLVGDARLANGAEPLEVEEKRVDRKASPKGKAAELPGEREAGSSRGKVASKKAKAKMAPATKKPPAPRARDKAVDDLVAVGGNADDEDADDLAPAPDDRGRAAAEAAAKEEVAARRGATRTRGVESEAGGAGVGGKGVLDVAPADELVESGRAEQAPSAGDDGRRYAPPPPPAAPLDEAEAATAAPTPAEPAAPRATAAASADIAETGAGADGRAPGGDDRLDRALLLRRSGLHREAVGEFEAYLAENRGANGLDRVWFEAAESYRALGQTDRALQLYRLVAGGESAYAGRARAGIDALVEKRAGDAKAGPQAAPAKAMPQAAPEALEESFAPPERE